MYIEYDENKDKLNRKNHGIPLIDAGKLWEVDHVIFPAKIVDGEKRFGILGLFNGKVYLAVFIVTKEGCHRIITFHRADKRYERIYYEKNK